MPSPAFFRRAAAAIDAIEGELRRLGYWQEAELPPEKLEFKKAFGADTMTLYQWLQFVLVPRVREIMEEQGEFPGESRVAVYAARELDGDPEAVGLVDLLRSFDALFEPVNDAFSPPVKRKVAKTTAAAAPAVRSTVPERPDAPVAETAVLRRLRDIELPKLEEHVRRKLGLDVAHHVAWATFAAPSPAEFDRRLEEFERSQWRNWLYLVEAIRGACPMRENVRRVVWEAVQSPAERAIYGFGTTLVFRVDPAHEGGAYSESELELLLPTLIFGMGTDAGADLRPEIGAKLQFTQALAAYREGQYLRETARVGAELHLETQFGVAWASLEGDGDAASALPIWGVGRILGALFAVASTEYGRTRLAASLDRVEWAFTKASSDKECRFADNTLFLTIAPQAGESGCFYESEIRAVLEDGLGLPWREQIGRLEAEALGWEKQLLEDWKTAVKYEVDWHGFTSGADRGTIQRGLYTLGEFGIDALFYACKNTAERDEALKIQFRCRVRALRVLPVASAKQIGLSSEGAALVLKLAVHSNPKGYLTIPEIEERLPRVLAKMKDLIDPAELDREPTREEEEALVRLEALESRSLVEAEEEEDDDDVEDADVADKEERDEAKKIETPDPITTAPSSFEEAAREIRRSLDSQVMPACAQQLENILGKHIIFEIDWSTMPRDPIALGGFITNALAVSLGAIVTLAMDPHAGPTVRAKLERVVLFALPRVAPAECYYSGGELRLGFDCMPAADPAAVQARLVDQMRSLMT